ncbi:MAG: hypothetical protein H0V17_03905 [Deltaproteobacteria bacterium]|nr:hypothetical protein [Deltaproteobacteria bacterium]
MSKLPALFLTLAASGCFIIEPDPVPCSNTPTCVPPPEPFDVMTVTPNLDLLFVIDDSPTMQNKQVSFQAAFPALLARLSAVEGGVPNLHLAVVSSDMGTSAAGDATPGGSIGGVGQGCSGFGKAGLFQLGQATLPDPDDRFLLQTRGGERNFEGTLADTFTAMSALGASGCGFEQPLAAMTASLSGPAENAGFLREGANLAVIVLSDEDDCSAEHTTLFGPDGGPMGTLSSFRCFRFGVECDQATDTLGSKTNCRPAAATHVAGIDPFASFLLGLKGDPTRVMFGAIVGDAAPIEVETKLVNNQSQIALKASCRYTPAAGGEDVTADPGVRFAALADSFEGISRLESICSEDLTAAAANLGDALVELMGTSCLPVTISNETNCFVEDRRDAEPGIVNVLQACSTLDGVGANCFAVASDPTCGSGQRLSISRPIPPHGDEWSKLRCLE